MSLEMAHKVILPPKKNYIPQFLKQRDINSYTAMVLTKVLYVADLLCMTKRERGEKEKRY
jgi:hypothetical protein